MALNDIMRNNPYFGLMKINTHDPFSLKHNKFIKIMTKPVQPLKFTIFFFYLKNQFSFLKLWVHATCHNSSLHKEYWMNI
jgi:hypothetical protein